MTGSSNYHALGKLDRDTFAIGDQIFVRAIVVRSRKPLVIEPAQERSGDPLFALPGGGIATRGEIEQMLSGAA